MGQRVDPLAVVLRSVRIAGEEFCWPATDIVDVLRAFEQLDRVILGAELWRFDDESTPTVVGWTQYSVSGEDWSDRVADASRRAVEELLGHAGDRTAWVHLTWEAPADAHD